MQFQTADLCDQYEDDVHAGKVRVVEPMFNSFGGRDSFHGPITTLKVFEDNSLVRKTLEVAGQGRILVVDGGGSLRCALLGDQLAKLAANHDWVGILVYGCVRDARTLAELPIGVFALETHPLKSVKKGVGEADIAVTFGGVTFRPGEYLYADEDGILIADRPL